MIGKHLEEVIVSDERLKVLFLCTGNACRSQMSEGWARHLKADRIEAYSAGVAPHGVDLNAVKVMAEVGVDISDHESKHVDELKHVKLDYIVSVCDNARESCPVPPPGTKHVHRGFDDPPALTRSMLDDEHRLEVYREVRDAIRDYVMTLPEALE